MPPPLEKIIRTSGDGNFRLVAVHVTVCLCAGEFFMNSMQVLKGLHFIITDLKGFYSTVSLFRAPEPNKREFVFQIPTPNKIYSE